MTNKLPSILIVGTINNVEKKLKAELARIQLEFSKVSEVTFFVVESDSTDSTVPLLEKLSITNRNLSFQTLGILRASIPDRIERIRYCRNSYIEHIRQNYEKNKWDYIVVADLDGMNPSISSKGIADSIMKMNSWDALFANQRFGYYDIFALRSTGWVEYDLLKLLRIEEEFSGRGSANPSVVKYFKNQWKRKKVLYSAMRFIPKKNEVIPVRSAFGGIGIYKPELFLEFDYALAPGFSPDGSEHITFHTKCVGAGYSLGINPRMINSYFNEYNVNKFFVIRFLKDFKRFLNSRVSRRRP
jgi:hypothetical protein